MCMQFTKTLAEPNMPGRRYFFLTPEEKYLVLEKGLVNFLELFIRDAICEIHATNLRAESGRVAPHIDFRVIVVAVSQ